MWGNIMTLLSGCLLLNYRPPKVARVQPSEPETVDPEEIEDVLPKIVYVGGTKELERIERRQMRNCGGRWLNVSRG